MRWNATLSRDLRHAIHTYDRPTVERLCEELIDDVLDRPDPPDDAIWLLDDLRRKRHFALLQRLADACIQSGFDHPRVRRQYAQSLIDQGCMTAAVAVLQQLHVSTSAADSRERREAAGLLGRAHKQMYVAAGVDAVDRRQHHLTRAITAYHDVYRVAPDDPDVWWHGINVVALLARAARDGVRLPSIGHPGTAAQELAAEILRAIDTNGSNASMWDRAIAVEACLALERSDDAAHALDRYVAERDADAFELASTLRQLQEVWQLSPTDAGIGERLIPVLQAELLRRESGRVEVAAGEIIDQTVDPDDEGYEKVFGSDRFTNLEWFRDALMRCRGVARIENQWRDGMGTGFLVDGASLNSDLPPRVLLTNAHVLGDNESASGKDSGALDLRDAIITFRAVGGADAGTHRVRKVHWSSSRDELDTTIASLETLPSDVPSLPIASVRPHVNVDTSTRTFIIGHPQGRNEPLFSIHDNHVLDADEVRIHYRTPTERGNSGSPVFNEDWQVIAIHHRGLAQMPKLNDQTGIYAANEGIWIAAIRAGMSGQVI